MAVKGFVVLYNDYLRNKDFEPLETSGVLDRAHCNANFKGSKSQSEPLISFHVFEKAYLAR